MNRNKKIAILLGVLLITLNNAACGQAVESINSEKEYSLSIEDFWKIEDIDSEKNATEKGVKFATGLEIVYPDIWWGKIELTTDVNTLAVCEKGNADAGIGGDLFYLCFYEHENDTVVIYDWDKVLGLYKQGGKEYVLVQDFPGDRCYSEDEQSLIDAYMELKNI